MSEKKNVWIMNHYAGGSLFNKGGRHYWISKFLKKQGYDPVVFVCNTKNGIRERYVPTEDLWTEKEAEETGVPYVFVRSNLYDRNGADRIRNMIGFYRNVQKAAKQYAKTHGKPDVIYASSVHPLTLAAGQKLARYFGVKCICEVRDLWPESLVAYGQLKRESLLAKALYHMEKRIYIRADKIIMTWPGGYEYIRDRHWDAIIPEKKVIHISNGVDLEEYGRNIREHPYLDDELRDDTCKKFIYTGSIRKVNNLGMIVDAAEILQNRGITGIKILIYGKGNERDALMERAAGKGLKNIVFAGLVPKESVPSLLTHAYVTLLHNSSTSLDKYGQSQNKFFEYLAAGRPVLMTYSVGYSICREKDCGFEIREQSSEAIADAIAEAAGMEQARYEACCRNAVNTAKQYDFAALTNLVASVIEEV